MEPMHDLPSSLELSHIYANLKQIFVHDVMKRANACPLILMKYAPKNAHKHAGT